MTLRHFRIFLAVCETGSMTAAAETLGMTQPAVSQSVAELERHYGAELFDRVGRRLRLNATGELLRGYAREILELVEGAERGIFESQDGGSLRVGASATVGAALLPPSLARLRHLMPRIRLEVLVDNTATVVQGLREARLDLGCVEGRGDWPDLEAEELGEDELRLVCGPGHEFAAAGRRLRPRDLEGRGFVLREAGSGTRELFESALAEAGIGWKPVGVANGSDAIAALVEAGLGLAFMSPLLISEALASGRLLPLEVAGLRLRRSFRLLRRGAKRPTEAMQRFARCCREEAGARLGARPAAPPEDK